MKTIVGTLFIALSVFCSYPTKLPTVTALADPTISEIHLNGRAVVRILYSNNTSPRPVQAYTNNTLTDPSGFRITDTIAEGSGYKDLVFEARSFQKGFLSINNYGTDVYLVPFDTLWITADLSSGKGWKAKECKGKYAFASAYYLARSQYFKAGLLGLRDNAANFSPNLKSYQQKMDSILKMETAFFEDYQSTHRLPNWFVEAERNEIRYADASLRVNTVLYRDFLKKEKIEDVPREYFRFVTPALLNNAKATHLYEYKSFVKDYFMILLIQQLGKEKADFKLTPHLAQQYLDGGAREMYMTWYINDLWSSLPTEGEQELTKYYDQFSSKELIDQIKAYYLQAYTLKTGEKAPTFYLKDQADSLISLKEFEGNVIYIGFWFVGCAPCITEIPYENALVERFKGQKVKIISICVRNSRENWMKMSNRYGLRTINLFANPNWEKSLIEKYNLKGYPHYVLIDKQGKVVENNCSRPSQNAAAQIEKLLL